MRLAELVGDLLELHPVVEGEDPHLGPGVQPVGGPVDLLELGVLAQRRGPDAALEEEPQLLPGRVGRGAAVARDREGAAGVGVLERGRPVLVGQPALEQPRHEAVAGAEHVEDLDREAGAGLALVEAVRDLSLEGGGAHRAALADERRVGDGADGAQGGEGVGGAAGDVELLLGADDQVEELQRRLQLGGDLGALDEAAEAFGVAGEAPEVRAVVDVERGAGAAVAGERQRLQDRGLGAGVGEMGAGDDDGAGVGDERGVDVGFAEGHVGAVLAEEDHREVVLVADAEDDERGQPLGVGDDAADVDAFGDQGLADEAAHLLVADAGDQPRLRPRRAVPAAMLVGEPPMYL